MKKAAIEHAGVAIVVHRKWWSKIKDVRPVNVRMMRAVFKTTPELNLAVVDAPHSFRESDEKETFYEELMELASGKNCNNGRRMWIISGDFNARAGLLQNCHEREVLGNHGFENAQGTVPESNEQVYENRKMFVAANTLFTKPNWKQFTYRCPATSIGDPIEDGGYEQIDFVLVGKRYKNAVTDCDSNARVHLSTDHYPIKCGIKCKLKNKNTVRRQNKDMTRSTTGRPKLQ